MIRYTSFIIFTILASASISYGQLHDTIMTDSDWEEFYREGYYDYNTYQLLREMVEGGDIDDTLEYMNSTLGASPADLELTVVEPDHPIEKNRTPSYFPDRIKIGRKIHEGKNSGYMALSERRQYGSLKMKLRDENGQWQFDNRNATIRRGRFLVTLGNYTLKIGCGLGIGRFDYRPVSYEKNSEGMEDLIFPDNSYYNGLKISYRHLLVAYSAKRYSDVNKNTFGSSFFAELNNIDIGVTGSATTLSSSGKKRYLGSGSIYIDNTDDGWAAEGGYGQSGLGFCARIEKSGSMVKIWGYDDNYINLHSSGYANRDYISYNLKISEISFRQAQQDETGLYLDHKLTLLGTDIAVITQIWKKSSTYPLAMEYAVLADKEIRPSLSVDAGLSERKNTPTERVLAEFGISFKSRRRFGLKSYFWYEDGRLNRQKSRYYIFSSASVSDNITIKGRFQWNFTGRLDYFIEQRSMIHGNLALTATYRWGDDYAADLGPLYVTMERLW